jgi:hypothetical protein
MDCEFDEPAMELAPTLQWQFTPDDGNVNSGSIPLVGNLTDDNGDGVIDPQDTPDVVLNAYTFDADPDAAPRSAWYVLDGATGALHLRILDGFWTSTPAIGDIDGDGIMEIVGLDRSGRGLVAYEHDGTVKWRTAPILPFEKYDGCSVVLADLDNDCEVEIIFDGLVLDRHGQIIAQLPGSRIPSAADIDGDGDLEILTDFGVYHHDGTVLFLRPDQGWVGLSTTEAADFDGDGEPEVLFGSDVGFTMTEHDGKVKYQEFMPLGEDEGMTAEIDPSVYDLDHDGLPEFFGAHYSLAVYQGDASTLWSVVLPGDAPAAQGAPTAFDLLGDGTPEILYPDGTSIWILDHTGAILWHEPHTTQWDKQLLIVADVDNDHAAEILVVSNALPNNNPFPTLRVLGDPKNRWAPARRIWNQASYHVTNVREDGTIPQFETPHWKGLNTHRVQAHIGPDGVCRPPG